MKLQQAAERILARDRFDESDVNRDLRGRFSDKPGGKGGSSNGGSSSGSSSSGSSRPKKKERRKAPGQLPDPGPTPRSGEKKQVSEIGKDLDREVDQVEDEFGFERTKGNPFERARELIRKLSKMISDKATKALVALQTAAIKETEKLEALEPKEYAEIPDHAYHVLHYAIEHSADIQAIVENVIVSEADNDAIRLFDESKVRRDKRGRFTEGLRRVAERLVEGLVGAPLPGPGKESVTLRKAGIEPAPYNNGTTRRLEAGTPDVGFFDVYVGPNGSVAVDHSDGTATVRSDWEGSSRIELPKPTSTNTKVKRGDEITATVSGTRLRKRADGVWESKLGPVGPGYAAELDRLLADQVEGKRKGADHRADVLFG